MGQTPGILILLFFNEISKIPVSVCITLFEFIQQAQI